MSTYKMTNSHQQLYNSVAIPIHECPDELPGPPINSVNILMVG